MRTYEGLFIFSPETAVQDNIVAEATAWIQKFEGSVDQIVEIGSRKLGYKIGKSFEGKAVVATYQMDPSKTDGFKKMLQLEPKLLAFTVTFPPSKKPVPKFFKQDDAGYAGAGYGRDGYGRD